MIVVIGILFTTPFVYIVALFYPHFKWMTVWKTPLIKYMSDLVSYLIFLVILLSDALDGAESVRKTSSTVKEVIIYIYVFSFLYKVVNDFLVKGLQAVSVEIGVILLICLSFLVAFLSACADFVMNSSRNSTEQVANRVIWDWNDPLLVGDSFYCVGIILSVAFILSFFRISSQMGPMLITLLAMLIDVIKMAVLFLILLFAFAFGMTRLLSIYQGMTRISSSGTESHPDMFTRYVYIV